MTANRTLLLTSALAAAMGLCATATAHNAGAVASPAQMQNSAHNQPAQAVTVHNSGTMAPPARMQKSAQDQSAQADESDARPTFAELDKNHDGKLSRSEIPHNLHELRARFRSYDKDGNGSLSPDEYQVFAHPPVIRGRGG